LRKLSTGCWRRCHGKKCIWNKVIKAAVRVNAHTRTAASFFTLMRAAGQVVVFRRSAYFLRNLLTLGRI
jgi:hypothetical protein